jgi:hypothetical protein
LSAQAFALRGPLEPWMTTNLSYGLRGDNGGPMALGSEYRRNLPVLTYGFDQSFLDHFGERGVQAVEEAIAILNALPPASEMDLDVFASNTKGINFEAQAIGSVDLKSAALARLLHHLGLAEPERYVWILRERNVFPLSGGLGTNYLVIGRNYDPHTSRPTNAVNGTAFTYQIDEFGNPAVADTIELAVDPLSATGTAVAQYDFLAGSFYTGLSRDDAGGLRYLYHATNINVEVLPAGIAAMGTNAVVNTAPRPGVDKIRFERMCWDTNRSRFHVMTNVFVDTYFSNGVPVQQTLQRILERPDITFRARAFPLDFFYYSPLDAYLFWSPWVDSTKASTWINNAGLNDRPGGPGPGTIPPGQVIDFSTHSRYLHAQLGSPQTSAPPGFGSFDGSTNAPVLYGLNDPAVTATIESRIVGGSFVWKMLGTYEATYRIDTTTNLVDWSPLVTVTNTRGYFSITNPESGPREFYRAVRTAVPGE